MSANNKKDDDQSGLSEEDYIENRLPGRTYISKGFESSKPGSSEKGVPARFVVKVFDDDGAKGDVTLQGKEWLISETPKRRYQVRFLLAREKGHVQDLYIERIEGPANDRKQYTKFHLNGQQAATLIKLLSNLGNIPLKGEDSVRIDDKILEQLFSDPESLKAAYQQSSGNSLRLRELIENDDAAADVIAIANRRKIVARFRKMLEDEQFFNSEKRRMTARGDEKVWQRFFEENPWILGAGLSGQLLTGWKNGDNSKLEQVVAGYSIAGDGKRTDALLKTNGIVSSMVFTEIKKHTDSLLKPINRSANSYRPGVFVPSEDLAGGIVQLQTTVHQAVHDIGDYLSSKDDDGANIPGEGTYLFHPRAYLIIGTLGELHGSEGGDHVAKIRSFELFRRSISDIEILTYDELLARAEWMTGTMLPNSNEMMSDDNTDTKDVEDNNSWDDWENW